MNKILLFVCKCIAIYAALFLSAYLFGKSWNGILATLPTYLYFGVGILLMALFIRFLAGRTYSFLQVFTHELTHAIFVFLTQGKIVSFYADQKQGEIWSTSNNIFMSLAPYCVPIYTFALLLFKPLILSEYMWILDILVGMTFAFHLHTIWIQTGTHQTDIVRYSWAISYPLIITMGCISLYITFVGMRIGFLGACWQFLKQAWNVLVSMVA
ncbi:MAG: hypothetical protein IJ417_06730 [Bacteroidaceae bacterium]|nr:hypothetical protein [Bacteroidaceae bacterium]